MQQDFVIRSASRYDLPALSRFLDHAPRAHRHLDWCPPLDWLGSQPFVLMDSDEGIQAVLACPEDPPQIAWIRYFACAVGVNPLAVWPGLFEACLAFFRKRDIPWLPALGLSDWFTNLLRINGFKLHQHIVTLEREASDPAPQFEVDADLNIRMMEPEDLPIVAEIDKLAFEPIWQNSLAQVRLAYNQSAYATVAEVDDELIGFQISTSNMFAYHLARLAVLPESQHRRIGQALVTDLIARAQHDRIAQLTINTQDDNRASLTLYERTGFTLTGDRFPVYLFPL